jgi:hypothetical protein
MAFVTRHAAPAAIVAAALAVTGGFFLLARPQYRPENQGQTVRIPDHRPADGWTWPDGVPGWKPGETLEGFDVSGVQPVEVQAAQLAAARNVLDASRLRVLSALRPDLHGALAIVAAPTLHETPARTCVAGVLQHGPVRWHCRLEGKRVVVAAGVFHGALYLVGVASGDVERVALDGETLYERGKTWGEFSGARNGSRLTVFGTDGSRRTLVLRLRDGEQRVAVV